MKFKRILYETIARIFPLHSNWTLNILNPEIIRVSNCESRCDEKRSNERNALHQRTTSIL